MFNTTEGSNEAIEKKRGEIADTPSGSKTPACWRRVVAGTWESRYLPSR